MAKIKKTALIFALAYTLYFILNLRPPFITGDRRYLLFPVLYALFFLAGLLIYRQPLKEQWAHLLQTWKKSALYTLLGLGLDFLLASLFSLFAAHLAQWLQLSLDRQNDGALQEVLTRLPLPILFTIIVLIGPMVEEFFYRQFLLGDLSSVCPRPLLMSLSALLFALGHAHQFEMQELVAVLPYLGSGLAYAFIYLKTKNIYCATFLHVLNNAMIFFLL